MTIEKRLEELENALESHDWFFRYSEDFRVYSKGRSSWNYISSEMTKLKELGYETEVNKLYKKHAPSSY